MKRKIIVIIPLLTILFNAGCKVKEPVDNLIIHANIYSVDSSNRVFEAMAVRNGRVVALGTDAGLSEKYQAEKVTDAHGKFIFPGFIDAHCHFFGLAQSLQYVDLTGAVSFEEVLTRIREANISSSGNWIVGRGWDQNLWKSKKFPDNEKLNTLYPNQPVMLIRIDGHVVLANQEALKRAGIGIRNTYNKGEVEVISGKLTGILGENAADKMRNSVPLPVGSEMAALIQRAEKLCLATGLICVSDAGLGKQSVLLLDSMQRKKQLSLFVYAMLTPTAENMEQFVKKGKYRTERLSIRSIKLYADGSLGSRSALLKRPYQDDPGNTGIMTTPADTLRALCRLAIERGYQVNTHCIGDSACRLVLDIYAAQLKGKNDQRWRIEHAQVVDPADLHLFGEFSIIPSVQATHATSDMRWAASRLGPERIRNAYAYKGLLNQNGWIANGTDFPIEQISPLLTFYAAIARKDLKGFPASGFQTENALSREEALRSITIWPARADFLEGEKGSLEPGKCADYVIVDQDIMKIPAENIPATKILQTVINGVLVYEREK